MAGARDQSLFEADASPNPSSLQHQSHRTSFIFNQTAEPPHPHPLGSKSIAITTHFNHELDP